MYILLTAFLITVCVVMHEAGHAYCMKIHGIQIKRAGLGFGPGIEVFSKKLGYPVKIGIILLGAFVEPQDGEMNRLKTMPYRVQAEIYGAGVIANIVFSMVIAVFLNTLAVLRGDMSGGIFLSTALFVVLAAVVWFKRCFVSMYLTPVIGILFLAFLVYILFFNSTPNSSEVSGPGGIVEIVGTANSFEYGMIIAMVISINIALFNMLPFLPLDGGRIYSALVRQYSNGIAMIFEGLSLASFIGLIAYIFIVNF